MPFCFAPLFQMTGLNVTHATDDSLIIAMEPLMTTFLGWLLLRDRLSLIQALSFVAALFGFCLLSGLTSHPLNMGWSASLVGDVLILISLVGESTYSAVGKKLAQSYAGVSIYGTSILVGVATLSLYVVLTQTPMFNIHLSLKGFLALLWLGPLGTTGAYILWVSHLKAKIPLAAVSLTLFFQPFFGAILNRLFLGDRLTVLQGFGGCVIILAVLLGVLLPPLLERRRAGDDLRAAR
jgi:drug/metabolite transporter (DMT)-like permease